MRKLTFINTYHREGKSPPTFFVSFLWFFFFFLPQILFTLTVVALSSSSRSLLAHSLTAQLCPSLSRSLDWSPPSSSVHGIFQARITGMGCHFLLQGIFSIQGLNPCFLHHRQILYLLSQQGSLGAWESQTSEGKESSSLIELWLQKSGPNPCYIISLSSH